MTGSNYELELKKRVRKFWKTILKITVGYLALVALTLAASYVLPKFVEVPWWF